MRGKTCVLLTMLVTATVLSGCSTATHDVETPFGPRPGDQIGSFEIIGIISKTTSTLRRADAENEFVEQVTVDVPPGTDLIIPTVRGWITGFGETEPENLAAETPTPYTWDSDDHHLGLVKFDIHVADINAVDPSTGTQTATVAVSGILSDNNSDDKWFAAMNYTLICLRRVQRP